MMRDAEWPALRQYFANKSRFFAPLRRFAAECLCKTFKLPALDIPKAGAQRLKALAQLTELASTHNITDDSIMCGTLQLTGHVPLFNPRTERWNEHFEWVEAGAVMRGKTPQGEDAHCPANEPS